MIKPKQLRLNFKWIGCLSILMLLSGCIEDQARTYPDPSAQVDLTQFPTVNYQTRYVGTTNVAPLTDVDVVIEFVSIFDVHAQIYDIIQDWQTELTSVEGLNSLRKVGECGGERERMSQMLSEEVFSNRLAFDGFCRLKQPDNAHYKETGTMHAIGTVTRFEIQFEDYERDTQGYDLDRLVLSGRVGVDLSGQPTYNYQDLTVKRMDYAGQVTVFKYEDLKQTKPLTTAKKGEVAKDVFTGQIYHPSYGKVVVSSAVEAMDFYKKFIDSTLTDDTLIDNNLALIQTYQGVLTPLARAAVKTAITAGTLFNDVQSFSAGAEVGYIDRGTEACSVVVYQPGTAFNASFTAPLIESVTTPTYIAGEIKSYRCP